MKPAKHHIFRKTLLSSVISATLCGTSIATPAPSHHEYFGGEWGDPILGAALSHL